MEQVKGISHYQGRLRRRVAGYAPWQWFSGCLLMVGYTQIRPLSDCIACVSCSIPTSLYTKKQTDEPSAFLHGAGEGNIPLSRSPSAPRCGLRALTAVFWVFAYDMVHPDSPPLRLYSLRLGFNSHFVICKKTDGLTVCFLHGAGEGNWTLDASLGSSNFTIKLHLQIDIEIMYVIILRMAELVKWMNHNINTIHIIKNRMQLLIIY